MNDARRLAACVETLISMKGRRAAAGDDLFRIADEVARAKGFLELRGEVEAQLQEFQAQIHARTVGSFETLLSLVVKAVIGDGTRIVLDLSTEGGHPALDVLAEKKGFLFDIMESEGGAMTNAVSMGLRLIATMRTGGLPFLLLDEMDCWISADRVGAFYGILDGLARGMGLQVVAVMHHPIDLVAHLSPRVFYVSGQPFSDEGVHVDITSRGREWGDVPNARGLRSIRLRDFAGYGDETFDFAPGLNIVTGRVNVGKSRVVRALKCLCYGESNNRDVRLGRSSTLVSVVTDIGETVEWTRDPKRTPVTEWRRLSASGEVLSTYGGRTPPAWTGEATGIAMRGDLDFQIGHQKKPVFVLDGNSRQRASVLSLGRESGLLRDMMVLHKKDVSAAQATVRTGERDVARLTATLEGLSVLDDIEEAADRAAELLALTTVSLARRTSMRLRADALEVRARGAVNAAERARVADLPPPPTISPKAPSARRLSETLLATALRLGRLGRAAGLLVPTPPPQALDSSQVRRYAGSLARMDNEISVARVTASLTVPTPVTRSDAPERLRCATILDELGDRIVRAARVIVVADLPTPPVINRRTAAVALKSAALLRTSEAAVQARTTGETALREAAEAELAWQEMAGGQPCPVCGTTMDGVAHAHD